MSRLTDALGGSDETFDDEGTFVEAHLPAAGEFLADHDVLTGDDHVAFHRTTHDIFEERTVYDVTFGYNLARLNLDARHENAGYRYAREADDSGVLRAEFTPTTPFCPQSKTLAVGSFRAWNGLSERHGYDLVRVRVDASHHQSEAINEELAALEETYRETGSVDALPDASEGSDEGHQPGTTAPF